MDAKPTDIGGRPTKYRVAMIAKVKNYIANCPDDVPSLCGLSMELNIGHSTLEAWKALDAKSLDEKEYPRFEDFQSMLDRLHAFQERTMLNNGANNTINSRIAKLVLSKHGYSDSNNLFVGGQMNNPITIQHVLLNAGLPEEETGLSEDDD